MTNNKFERARIEVRAKARERVEEKYNNLNQKTTHKWYKMIGRQFKTR